MPSTSRRAAARSPSAGRPSRPRSRPRRVHAVHEQPADELAAARDDLGVVLREQSAARARRTTAAAAGCERRSAERGGASSGPRGCPARRGGSPASIAQLPPVQVTRPVRPASRTSPISALSMPLALRSRLKPTRDAAASAQHVGEQRRARARRRGRDARRARRRAVGARPPRGRPHRARSRP